MASDGRVVAEDFIFDDGLAGADSVVKVRLVIDGVALSGRIGIGLAFRIHVPLQGFGLGMFFVPLLQVLIA